MPRFLNTIQRKLLLLFILVGFLPAAAAVLHVNWGAVVGVDSMLGSFLEERAADTAGALDRVLNRYFDAAETLAQGYSSTSPGAVQRLREAALFDRVAVTTPEGIAVENDDGRIEEYSLPASVKERRLDGGVFLHESPHRERNRSTLLFISRISDTPPRLLVASVDSSRLLPPGTLPGGQSLSIYSNRGVWIAGTPASTGLFRMVQERASGPVLAGWFVRGEGTQRKLVGYAASKLLRGRRNENLTSVNWVVLARMDTAEVSALFSHLLWRSLLFGFFLMPWLILLSYSLARRFLRPIRQLHEQVDRLAGGDLGARVQIRSGDELEQLGTAFNDMARGLDFSQSALEEQMKSVEDKARQIALVHNIASAIISAFDLPRLFRTTHEQLTALLPYDAMTAVISRPREGPPEVHHLAGGVFEAVPPVALQMFYEESFRESEAGHVLDSGTGGGTLPPAGPPPPDSPIQGRFAQMCLLPLRAEPGLIGALVLGRTRNRPFTAPELRILVQISQVLAVAVEHIELYEQSRRFAQELENKVAERAEELERAHEKLVRAERFAATGRLAASIAHEINNPLGIIKNYLRILRDAQPALEPGASDALVVVNEELDRIARIIRSLLYFYRPSKADPVPLDLNQEIRVLLLLMEAAFRRKNIQVEADLQPDLPMPRLSPDHVRQVLLNLLRNAEDAVGEKGTIRITTRLSNSAADPGTVVLEIADDGCGISPEDLPHIFEPFYTSKKEGHGTGLGLSVTYGILRSMKGSIDVESIPGTGTTFTVKIPVAEEPITLPA